VPKSAREHLYGLTPAEARLAQQVLDGHTMAGAHVTRGVATKGPVQLERIRYLSATMNGRILFKDGSPNG
jgi:hypothetical protein